MDFSFRKLMALACTSAIFLSLSGCGGTTRDYEEEIRVLKQENVALAQLVEQLQQQLIQLQTVRLESWTLDATGTDQDTPATLRFSARPMNHEPGQSARLLVMLEGQQELSVPCDWDGEAFTADFSLPPKDGYGYYCLLTGEDGQAEQVPLSTPDSPVLPKLTYLRSSLACYAGVTLSNVRMDTDSVTLDMSAVVQTPLLYADGGEENIESAQLLWLLEDETLASWPVTFADGETEGGYHASGKDIVFAVPEMEEGREVLLLLSVTLSSGRVLTAQAGSWISTDGILVASVG